MISKRYIKDMEFKNIEEMFNYIITSFKIGAISQSKKLSKKLSNQQFKDFINHCEWVNINPIKYMLLRLD